MQQGLTVFGAHVHRWKKGCGSRACDAAYKRAFVRGDIPCEVLFIGIGPGESENAIGLPFVGPAGQLLDDILKQSIDMACLCRHDENCGKVFWSSHRAGTMTCCPSCGRQQEPRPVRYALTNLVCCMPRDENGDKTHEPTVDQVESCQPRLFEFVEIAKPKLVILVGKLAASWHMMGGNNCTAISLPGKPYTAEIMHPSAILQKTIADRALLVQKAAIAVSDALETYL